MNKYGKSRTWYGILLVALAACAVLFALQFLNKGEPEPAYPDLGMIQLDHVPEDFELARQPYLGNPDAPVQIVEFADYKCPACKRWKDEVLTQLMETYINSGQAVYYYVDLPFLAPDSTLAALAGETLYQQDPSYFWTYFDLMMQQQGKKDEEWANRKFILSLVEDEIPDADFETFKKELDEEKYLANIKRDVHIADNYRVDGTPTVFVNGQMVEDASFEGIKSAIEGN